MNLSVLAGLLRGAGFVAAEAEAAELLGRAAGDIGLLTSLVGRRLAGEPLAWITGHVSFCGVDVRVDVGVYVPRWHTEALARRGVELLPADGVAVDLCTGTGAIAASLSASRPGARVVASDIDERAVACAASNGVEVYLGDLFAPLPPTLAGTVDLVVAVVPYVPTPALALLARDTLTHETPLSYDGGTDGTDIVLRVLTDCRGVLRPGGALLLELGGDQAELLRGDIDRLGFVDLALVTDEEGGLRGIECHLSVRPDRGAMRDD